MDEPQGSFRSVLKFGGSCLKSSHDISSIAERILELDSTPVVVVSAFFLPGNGLSPLELKKN